MVRTWSVRDWSLGVFLAAALGAQVFGQSVVVPNANATVAGNDNSGLPQNTPLSLEAQTVINPDQFPKGPIYITGVSFRAAPGTGPLNLTASGSISLSTSPNYANSNGHPLVSTTFANNVGSDNTLVFSATNITVSSPGCTAPGPCPFGTPIQFKPFLYDPSKGPLLIDQKDTSFTATSGQIDIEDCNLASCSVASVEAVPLGSATATKVSPNGTILQITYSTDVTVVPNGNATRAGGDSSGPLPTAPMSAEFQTVYGGGQFPPGPIYITGFTFRAAPGKGPLSVTTTGNVYLSTSPNFPNINNGHPLLSTTFADNVGPDNTLVASGTANINGAACAGPAPCPFATPIVFTKPFFYDPASGSLLIDIQATAFSAASGQFDVVDCTAPGCGLANIFGTPGSATATQFNYGGQVTQIMYTTVPPVTPAPTTNFTYTANVTKSSTQAGNFGGNAPVVVTPFGNATLQASFVVPVDQNENVNGLYQATLGFFFNGLDSFTVSGSLPSIKGGVAETFTANVTGGTGALTGVGGSVNLILTLGSSGGTLTGSGNIILGGKTTPITIQSAFPSGGAGEYFTSTLSGSGTGTMGSLGTASIRYNVNDSILGDPTSLTEISVNFSFNANDGFFASFKLPSSVSGPPTNVQGVIVDGRGAFSGASGTVTLTSTKSSSGNTLSGSGSVTVPAPGSPVITSVTTAFGPATTAQNTWLAIKGNFLVPSTTPATGVDWSNAPDFASGMMPTVLNNVSVKINNKPGYMYFFCSAVTDPSCPVDQINVLAPLDATQGGVTVVVTSPTGTSGPYRLRMETNSPSFLLFDVHGDIIARHLDATYSLLGPTTFLPGLTTPAKAGETILLAGIGFGLPTNTLVDGSSTQSGPLPSLPVCYIGMNQATVVAATFVSPGLYLLTVTVPIGTPSGDNLVFCSYQGNALITSYTPAGYLLNVQ